MLEEIGDSGPGDNSSSQKIIFSSSRIYLLLFKNRNNVVLKTPAVGQGTGDKKVKPYRSFFTHVISENRKAD